jgi:hypothetical protein
MARRPSTPTLRVICGLPTLPTYAVSKSHWVVWCQPERCWHWHGSIGGHRTAHCQRGAPYEETGYNLERTPRPMTPAIRRDIRRRRPLGPSA